MNAASISTPGIKESWINYIHDLQDRICQALEQVDGQTTFKEDKWERTEGGGGKTRLMTGGAVFEKGGVNTSIVFGPVTELMRSQLKIDGDNWFACGLSLVLHPNNPFVPTVHCNYRMFELYNANNEVIDRWFGGGTDLTPYYLIKEDAVHFHGTYKNVCDQFDKSFFPKFKKECDDYFVNKHRNNERRGIGGIFYDYQRPTDQQDVNFWMNFGKSCGDAFIPAYVPIVEKRKNTPYTSSHKYWQEIRRGRYTEFNLVHDRGTIFGLKTNGRIESILMSLPPTVRFDYNYQPAPGTPEEKLQQVCLQPVDWV
ncbi:oxygen-dependent coproporphyrinogen oxidase [Pseudoflavitalea sp. X16]|uniref:oxygen-dependent coproporphyrinogen oxidase n=1 Tax=Paraflavitalea devenefica TaxID=2716334 RepID=UPI00141FFBBB|nr:oxygen-dependent coproporphyrinogen oxidase [Paraflavitalea devenefica]NII24067.1 oxygen-dependent coproporphyrinogen oxidase [Paraflavitalea devenefica]